MIRPGTVKLMATLLVVALALAGALPLLPAGAASAQARTPLLMQGKKALYQRVLTRPEAQLFAKPGDPAGKPLPALSQFYVYDRKPAGGAEWLEVGAGSRGRVDGWIPAAATLAWDQQMALAFTNPAPRGRALLFAERQTVLDLWKSPDPGQAVAAIRQAVEAGKTDPRVVSIEPATYIDIEKQFYLLPILKAEEVDTGSFRPLVLEVASVTAKKDSPSPAEAAAKPAQQPQVATLRTFSAALVFVIDSTISMGPYIDRTRQAVRSIYERVEKADLGKQVKFGLIAYRSSTAAVPQLEYVAKVYADPSEVQSGADFLAKVADLKPASVSSAKFAEDSYAGLLEAVNSIKWDRFGGRYVVLITDAGAIEGSDPLSSTHLNADQVRLELERLGIALYALHLRTPEGKRDHASAERQYKAVTQNPVVNRPLYYPVAAGSVEQFGTAVDALAASIVAQVQSASKGELVPGSARAAAAGAVPQTQAADPQLARLQEDQALLGRAMQLAYLGRVQGTSAPPLFKAWLSDRDFAQPDRATTRVIVLLTKNQLSDMAQVVGSVLDAGEKSQQTSSADFFDLIRSAAANLARDPKALNNPQATKLGQLGLLGEYLEDLPYKSEVMAVSREDWSAWSTPQQEEFLDSLRRKLRLYRVYNEDVDRWVSLAPGSDPGDAVYPVPLEALP